MSVGLVVEIIGDASRLKGELDKSAGSVEGWAGGLAGTAVKVAAVAGVAAIAATAIASMTDAAIEDQAEQARLTAAVQAAGAAHGDYAAQLEAAIAAGQDKAFTDTQSRDALQSLVTATGDVTSATALLTTAQDIARFANVDLATAADAVAKAQAGQDGALRKLMPGLEKGATATDTLATASSLAAGQADAYASSAKGMQDRAGDAFSELGETIGAAFIPIVEALMPAILPFITALGKLVQAILPILIPLLRLVGQVLGVVAGVLTTVVGWITQLVTWLGKAIDALGHFLDSINPLKGISLPSLPFLSSSSAAAGAGPMVGARASSSGPTGGGAAGGIVVNVGSADPEAVIRALRRWAAANGGAPAFSRTLDRAAS